MESLAHHQSILTQFDKEISRLKRGHGRVLSIWALINLVVGIGVCSYLGGYLEGGTYFYFWSMNASWGLVNLFVGIYIVNHHQLKLANPLSLLQQLDYQWHAEKMIFLNIGLDLFFLGIGATMLAYGHTILTQYPELWVGFGVSVIIQGGFLICLDMVFYRGHRVNLKRTYPIWKKILDGESLASDQR
jgi:hypothetical protein